MKPSKNNKTIKILKVILLMQLLLETSVPKSQDNHDNCSHARQTNLESREWLRVGGWLRMVSASRKLARDSVSFFMSNSLARSRRQLICMHSAPRVSVSLSRAYIYARYSSGVLMGLVIPRRNFLGVSCTRAKSQRAPKHYSASGEE